jgi:CelD/BcsL family acetyltransferase involved in cellulose biosynthesis
LENLKIRVIDSYSDFIAMQEIWNSVLQKSNHTIFSTWEWLSTWWKHWGKNRNLLILLAEDNGELLGIAPLMQSTYKALGVQVSKIEFIGTPHSDYHELILAGKEKECINLFVNYLKNLDSHWDCIDLVDFPETTQYLPLLSEALAKDFTFFHDCSFMTLPNSYDAFLKDLSRNQRKNLFRTGRRLEEQFKVEFVDYSKLDSTQEGIQILRELHQKRWNERGLPGVFANPVVLDFNLDVSQIMLKKNWLALFLLRLSGKPACVMYGFKYKSKFYEYLTGLEPSFGKFNTGNLLRANMIEAFINEGLREYDFMRGYEEYKERWNTTMRWNRRATLKKNGASPSMKLWLYNNYIYQTRRAKELLHIN